MSPLQFASGNNKRISHAINFARDAVFSANKKKEGAGLADLDFQSAFDFLCMSWVERVLEKKGLHMDVINRMRRYYKNGVTIPVINNIQGRKIQNYRRTLRQGDCPSSVWFNYGIDPLIHYLDKRLQGIIIQSSPVSGPAMKH